MTLNGIKKDLLPFLNFLKAHKIWFTGDESVMDDQKQLFDLIIERGT